MFEVKKEVLDTHEALLTVEFEETAVQDSMQKAARKISREVLIPGFRQGKAPYAKVARYVGENAVRQEAADLLIQDQYTKIIEQAEIAPYSSGELDDMQLDPLVIKIRVPLEPTVDLGEYQNIRQEWQDATVGEEEIDGILQQIREEHAILEAAERPAQLGDEVHIDVVGKIDGEEVIIDEEDVKVLLDPDTPFLAPGFVEALVGMSVDEEKAFKLTLPEDLENESLRGVEVDFEVAIAEVYARQLPDLDDALASTVGAFETLDALKEDIHTRFMAHKEQNATGAYQNDILKKLVQQATVHYPPVMLEEALDDIVEETNEHLEHDHQMSLEDALRLEGRTMESFREQMQPQADERVRRTLVLREFAGRENIEVSDDELVQGYTDMLVSVGMENSEAMGSLQLDSDLGHRLRNSLTVQKLMNRLVQIGRGEAEATAPEVDVPATDAKEEAAASD
ncbi:MAG: trigger factor [Anaerolineae bacterium]|nr:trigger factor [Anaerolineae bacterium]